jgi:hypothetical protein
MSDLLEIIEWLGFDQRWRDIMSLIWATTSSHILLNGEPNRPIKHRRGLKQGDPLFTDVVHPGNGPNSEGT